MQVMNETQKETVNKMRPIVKYNLDLKSKDDSTKAANAFLVGSTGRFGKYFALPNALVYRTIITNSYGDKQLAQNIIARRVTNNAETFIVGNSSILPLIGRRMSFGNETLNMQVVDVQTYLSERIQMIPFSVFDEACLDLNKYKLLDRGVEETVTRKIDNPEYKGWKKEEMQERGISEFIYETVHFTGASLFEVDGSTFLFDIDRIEIDHKIFNPFLVKIPVNVETIKQAYLSLKPQEVINAESQGLKVERQGEWFFIPMNAFEIKKMQNNLNSDDIFIGEVNDNGNVERYSSVSFELKAGNNRPNYCQNGFAFEGKAYVSGLVQHSGREHRDITLDHWCYAVPNTSTESFTITGDID